MNNTGRRTCTLCTRPHNARGYCNGHYRAFMEGRDLDTYLKPNEESHPEYSVHRVRELVAANPKVSAIDIGKTLEISRTRVYQIRKKYGI